MGQQDGQAHRVAKQVNGTTIQAFLYKDSLRIIAELDAAGEIVSHFNYVAGSHSPDTMTTGGQTYRFVKDQVGSPRLVVNVADGSVAQRIDYDAFGVVTQDTNPGFQPFGFAGGLYDADTGLVRFGARDYDAQSGRWTAKDPIRWEGGQTNVFIYVNDDPVNRSDPTGLRDLPGTWDNGVVVNDSDRYVVVVSDTDGARVLAPGESSDPNIDTDFVIDGANTNKVGPNNVRVNQDGTVSQFGLDLIPGNNPRPYDPKVDGSLPDHHPDPWGSPMCSALY